jgi:Cytochrome c
MHRVSDLIQSLTVWKLLSGSVLVTALTIAIPASPQSTKTGIKIKQTEVRYISPVSGRQMYESYCASCHGVDGRGDANAAAALPQPITDLTLLSIRNGGKFPVDAVYYLVTDKDSYHDHAGDGMPVWGTAFKSLQPSYPLLVGLRAYNLIEYLKAMQAPPAKTGTDLGGAASSR